MMKDIKLLDCTLRDGGYLNDWEFGHNKILSIYERLIAASVDIIEIGFIDERRPFDINRSIFPDTDSIGKSLATASAKPSMLVGMVDYGTCSIDKISNCENSILDGIRVIFKKPLMHEAMDYVAQLINQGYKVFAQLVAVSEYNEQDIREITNLVNSIKPYAVSMVDTYGMLYPQDIVRLYGAFDDAVDPKVTIGFHAHNNLQLGYANALAFIGYETERSRIVDGTLYGMGKSAGNDPLELVASYLNEQYGHDYRVGQMLEAIEESIKEIYVKTPWGYRTQFFLSAENNCHPSYVSYLQSKDNLSVSDINSILSEIESDDKGNRKLYYNKEYIEDLYKRFVSRKFDDEYNGMQLKAEFSGRVILIVGPGKNIILQSDVVDDFIRLQNPVVIAINYIPEHISVDYVFVTKKNRYQEMTDSMHMAEMVESIRIISTSDVNPREKHVRVFDRGPLLEKNEEITDNSFLMLLKILRYADVREVYCAGLDGYSDREDNYYQKDMEYSFVKEKSVRLNHHIREVLLEEFENMNIHFITYSHYTEEED